MTVLHDPDPPRFIGIEEPENFLHPRLLPELAEECRELLVEEPSMEAALRLLLPKMIGTLSFEVYRHQCKDELLARLPQRLRAYATWIPENWRIVVVVDRDGDDCEELKSQLEEIATDAGLVTRSSAGSKPYVVVNRIAIEELEAWYFGDWEAVRAAYPRVSPIIPAPSQRRASNGRHPSSSGSGCSVCRRAL